MTRAKPPFFVVGFPRSGTKMLRELLNKSPDIWLSDIESNFIPRFTREVGRYGDLADYDDFERLAEALEGTRAFWLWQRRGVRIDRRRWFEAMPRHDWPGVFEGLLHCVYEQEMAGATVPWDAVLWGDKTPLYMLAIPVLNEMFPESRFIHIVRDPRDCILSSAKAWGNSPLRTAQEWADCVRVARRDGAALGPERYVELRYEDLVTDVVGVLTRLYDFLGVPTPADVGTFRRVPENVGDARGATHVVAENQGKWRNRMSDSLRRRIEGVCGEVMTAMGYEREHPDVPATRVGTLRMRAYKLRDAWHQIRFQRQELGGWIASLGFLLTRRERI